LSLSAPRPRHHHHLAKAPSSAQFDITFHATDFIGIFARSLFPLSHPRGCNWISSETLQLKTKLRAPQSCGL
jgi:hypothetical protein